MKFIRFITRKILVLKFIWSPQKCSLWVRLAWNCQRVVTGCCFPRAGPYRTLLPTLIQGCVFISWAAVKTLRETPREVKEDYSHVAAACFTSVSPLICPLQNFLFGLNEKRIGDNMLQFISSHFLSRNDLWIVTIFWRSSYCYSSIGCKLTKLTLNTLNSFVFQCGSKINV